MFYVYDVDMTLAESDCMMEDDFAEVFRKAMAGKQYFFCSGSALPKMKMQIPADIIENAAGLLPVMGGELWKNGERVYQRTFEWPEGLEDDLKEILANSKYEERTGDHIQDRETMICFSTVGKAADMPARKRYEAWEDVHNERQGFAEVLRAKYPDLNFVIGGKTSIDISEKGNDKGQVLAALRQYYSAETPLTFIGDRMWEGGNDYPLMLKLEEEAKATGIANKVIPVKDPKDTMRVLSELIVSEKVA